MTPEEAKTIVIGSEYYSVTRTGQVLKYKVGTNVMELWEVNRTSVKFLENRFLTKEETEERALIVRAQWELQK